MTSEMDIKLIIISLTAALSFGNAAVPCNGQESEARANDAPSVDWNKVRSFSADSLYKLARNSYVGVKWDRPAGKDIAHWTTEGEKRGEIEYWYFIPGTHKHPLRMLKNEVLYEQLAVVDSAAAARTTPDKLRIYPEFTSAEVISFEWAGKRVSYSIRSGKVLSAKPRTPHNFTFSSGDYWKKWSADSSFFIYAKDHQLHLADAAGNMDATLSSDGELYHSFSSSGARQSEGQDKPGYAIGSWISDTHSYFILREDTRNVGTMSIINSLKSPRPETSTYKYALAGDKYVPQYDCFIVNADSLTLKPVQIEKWKDQKIILPRFKNVVTTSDAAWVLRVNRELDSLDLCRIDAATGQVSVVISEECKPHYNENLFSFHILSDGKEILWWSEREGKGAWYLYGGDGHLKNKVTGGDFVAGAINRIDTTGRSIILCGYGYYKDVNPEYDFYFKADLDGRKTVCLTPENGHHSITLSESGKYLSDTYSRMDCAPQTRIYDTNGRERAFVCATDMSGVYATGWKEPILKRLKSADGKTDLWGIVYMPKDIKPGHKYPIISDVYPGPQTDLIPKAFTFDDDGNHSMAQMGCVVINFMHRGCNPWMGREFFNYGYGNLRDYPLEDDKAIIEQLAREYDFIDIDRVGIFGHSGGGFMSATAILTFPDFYKVAVAASGNYDNNIYSMQWGEAYHGVARDSSGTFVSGIPSTQELASRLKGNLLLITGDMDNNVHPASTYRLANALIKAGKRFDMLVIPGADHGLGGAYYDNTIRYYFLKNLLGVDSSDIDIVNHR